MCIKPVAVYSISFKYYVQSQKHFVKCLYQILADCQSIHNLSKLYISPWVDFIKICTPSLYFTSLYASDHYCVLQVVPHVLFHIFL